MAEQKQNNDRQKKRAERFVAHANKGTNLALGAIGRLERLADRGKYVYSQEQVQKLVDALKAATERLEQRFTAGDTETQAFKL